MSLFAPHFPHAGSGSWDGGAGTGVAPGFPGHLWALCVSVLIAQVVKG